MKQGKWNAEQEQILVNLWNEGFKKLEIAEKMGKTYFSVKRKIQRLQSKGKLLKREPLDFVKPENKKHDEINISNNSISCRFVENHPLSIDEVWEKFKLSTTEKVNIENYEVYNIKIESWDVTIKQKDGSAKAYKNYLTDVRFRLKKPKELDYQEDKKQLLDICKNYAPKIPKIKYAKNKDPKMLEMGLYDVHAGKLSIIDMTGETASLKGTSTMTKNATVDLIERVQFYNIEKIYLPIGQDWMHINNEEGTTVKGTKLEYTNHLFQIRNQCKQDLIWMVEYLRQVAPVEIIYVPGNHDAHSTLALVEILNAYFHNCKDVIVDTSPRERKAITYGKNFIGFTHGDSKDIRADRLPLIFAREENNKWANSNFHEIHLGHIHHKKDMTFIIGDEFNGVRIRWIPSLASADSWHYRHGYVKSRKSAEAFIWDKEHGCIGNFAVNVRMK
jgi:hypothetical protein